MDKTFKINIVPEKFDDFKTKLKELSNIENIIKIKLTPEYIYMYSAMGGQAVIAFKNYLLKTTDYFGGISEDIDIIIPNAKRLVKNLSFFKDSSKTNFQIKCRSNEKGIFEARMLKFTNGRLIINWVGGDNMAIRDIPKDMLYKMLDVDNRRWYFNITSSDFADIKSLSGINPERLINIAVNKGKVVLSELGSWELQVDNIEEDRSGNYMLNKKFLNNIITTSEIIEYSIYDTFMLIINEDSNLMLSYEQDFTE